MQNIPIRKILASILFVLIILFTYLIFKEIDKCNLNSNILVLFGGIIFSSLFLFSVIFTKSVIIKTIYEEKKGSTIKTKKEENKDKKIEKITFKESINIIKGFEDLLDIRKLSEFILKKLSHNFNAVQGVMYFREKEGDFFINSATYAIYGNKKEFKEGSGINGQVAINKKIKIITEIPEGYISVVSGLGSASPSNLLIIPFVFENKTVALIELAAFDKFPEYIEDFYYHINNKVSKHYNKLINEQ